ncbi:MAG: PCRF domain-containing protein [Elusimicrobia bacterium]|nr:PCRF domain-containing protein [Elusimicrobiota bacterium]
MIVDPAVLKKELDAVLCALSNPKDWQPQKLKELSRRKKQLETVLADLKEIERLNQELPRLERDRSDQELAALAEEEIKKLSEQKAQLENETYSWKSGPGGGVKRRPYLLPIYCGFTSVMLKL